MLLSIEALQVCYGHVQAVRHVSLSVTEGEAVALIGANGAGKSTTLRTVAGLMVPKAGQIRWRGQPIHAMEAHRVHRLGISLVPEGRGIFPQMTVLENVLMGAYGRKDKVRVRSELHELLGVLPRLQDRLEQKAGTLSGGEQQMMVIARALMGQPRLLLLDEPSMGLAPVMVQEVFALIERVRVRGVSLLLVEQNARLALRHSQRAYVMEHGVIRQEGRSSDLAADPLLQEAYLGTSLAETAGCESLVSKT